MIDVNKSLFPICKRIFSKTISQIWSPLVRWDKMTKSLIQLNQRLSQ